MMKTKLVEWLMARYKQHKQRVCNTSLEHCIYVAEAMRNKAKYCFIISNGSNGWCSTRLVEPVFTKDEGSEYFTAWISAHPDSRKIDELWTNPKVTLAFEDARQDANLIIYGKAFVENHIDIKKRHWKRVWKMFFPEGAESDDYVLIRIEPSRMEILNFKKNITPEPFGLKAAALVSQDGQWLLEGD